MTVLPSRFGVAVLLALTALAGCGGSGEKGARSAADESGGGGGPAEIGKQAPDLSIQSLNGKGEISLEAKQGKVLIIDFWATWCEPCRASFPKLEELSKRLGDKAEVIGISVDDEEKGILEFARENGATFNIGWDSDHAIASRWNVKNMPTTFIVDGNGKVRFIHAGYHDGETKEMEKEVASIHEDAPAGDTRVAKNDKDDSARDAPRESDDEHGSDNASEPATASGASEDDESDAPPPPPKKKAAKKGGKKAAKKGGKKATKKKK
ncbi:MAG: TlpA family protein disulfide reductase [Labilithrix sp.]|nr:TlpA family protein disulfide reductase [Labilithrix sp.]